MSKHNNVNPDYYKIAGREPQGQGIVHDIQRRKLTKKRSDLERAPAIPGTAGRKKAVDKPET